MTNLEKRNGDHFEIFSLLDSGCTQTTSGTELIHEKQDGFPEYPDTLIESQNGILNFSTVLIKNGVSILFRRTIDTDEGKEYLTIQQIMNEIKAFDKDLKDAKTQPLKL